MSNWLRPKAAGRRSATFFAQLLGWKEIPRPEPLKATWRRTV